MELLIETNGTIRCIYAEALDLAPLGRVLIARGSYVEPEEGSRWFADLKPVGGPRLGPFPCRSDALEAETEWLHRHWLLPRLDRSE